MAAGTGDPPAGRRPAGRLIDLLTRTGHGRQAVAELLQLASDPAADSAARRKAGEMLLERGGAREAADVFGGLTNEHPHDGDLWNDLGNAQFAAGDFDAARGAYSKALRWSSNDRSALVHRLAVTNTVIALDPTGVHLSASARNRRSRDLVSRVLTVLERCGGGPDHLAGGAATVAEAARRELSQSRREEGDTPHALALVQQLWTHAQPLCLGQQPDEAAAALVAKLAK